MTPNLLTIEEVASVLRVTTARAYELARTGLLPVVKVGRQVRINSTEFEAWIAGGGASLPGGWRMAP